MSWSAVKPKLSDRIVESPLENDLKRAHNTPHVAAVKSFRLIDVCFVALVALLGLWGGTPYDHPDFLTAFVGKVWESGGNPQFFHYGSLIIYLFCAVYGLTYVLLRVSGVVTSPGAFKNLTDTNYLLTDPIKVEAFFPGHLFIVMCSFLALASVYWLTLRLTQRRPWAYCAVLFLGVSYQWVADSHFLTVDIPMVGMLTATLALAFILNDRGVSALKSVILLGACAGLIAGAKYPGGLVAIPLFISSVVLVPRVKNRIRLAVIFPVVSLAVFLLTNPFIVLDFARFYSDFAFELAHAKGGHPGYTSPSFFYHTRVTLMESFGLTALLLALVGLVLIACSSRLLIREKILLLLYPVLQYFLISTSSLSFQRYAIPLFPFIAIFCAYALAQLTEIGLGQTISKVARRIRTTIATLIALVIVVPNLTNSIQAVNLLYGLDSREIFSELISDQDLGRFHASNYLRYLVRSRLEARPKGTPLNALFVDSFTYDRDLYEECTVDPRLLPLFSQFDRVLIINPFDRPKDEVPFSPQSLYAPAPPDLPMRLIAGPYIEIYFSGTSPLGLAWSSVSRELVSIKPATDGYYYRQLPKHCTNAANRKQFEIEKLNYAPRWFDEF